MFSEFYRMKRIIGDKVSNKTNYFISGVYAGL